MQNEISVYIDIIFLENLVIDYVIVDISGRLSGITAKRWRIVAGAATGALYAVVVSVFTFLLSDIFLSLLLKLVISFMMCAVAFGIGNGRKLVVSNVILYIVSFLLAGIFTALNLSGNPITIKNGGIVLSWGKTTALYIVETIFLGYIFVSFISDVLKKNRKISNEIIELDIVLENKCVKIAALCDTGNELYDSLHNLPVIICETDQIIELFEESIKEKLKQTAKFYEDGTVYNLIKIFEEANLADRISVISYKTVSGTVSMMVGFVCRCIYKSGEKIYEKKVTACLVQHKLTETGGYNAIAPPEIFNNIKNGVD